MAKQAKNKFTWIIKNFSSVQSRIIQSDQFIIDDCKWCLFAYPKGYDDPNHMSLFLAVVGSDSLPCGWRRLAKFRLTIVNQLLDQVLGDGSYELERWFDHQSPILGYSSMLSHAKLYAKDGGFLVNNEVKIVVEVNVLEVIRKLDVEEETKETKQQHLKKMKLENGGAAKCNGLVNKTKETVEINGFHVLSSQVESVKLMFEKHPDMAVEFRAKSQHLRTACMNVLLYLIETLCRSLQELSNDDLLEADKALAYVKDSGFKVDWLETKLEEVKRKKREEQICETRMRELEEELKDLKRKCLNVEDLLAKEKGKVLATRGSTLTLHNVF